MTDGGADPECQCKVGTMIDSYELDHVDGELIDRWTGPGETESLRSLADWFNRELLRREMAAAGMDVIEGNVENYHRLLTDPDVLEAVRMEATSSLSDHGIDVDRLLERFVSHQTVYRHLGNCLEVEQQATSISVETEDERINALQNRAEAVISDSLRRLQADDEIAVGDVEVLVNFRVLCESCGSLEDVSTVLQDQGCDCRHSGLE